MSDVLTRWAVVATVDEPCVLVQCFTAWHLALGAAEVFLYFDRPDDPAADLMESWSNVRVQRCDQAHWGAARPIRQEIRQTRNANDAYAQFGGDWLLHCDADEFLCPDHDIPTALASVDPDCDAAIVAVAERMYHGTGAGIFAGTFRKPFAGSAARGLTVFGGDYALTGRGLTGHALGKVMVRGGRDLGLSIHRPKPQPNLQMQPLGGVTLLHFDGLTPLQWVVKLYRRAVEQRHGGMPPSPHRQAQIDAILADPARALALHDRLKRPDPALLANLQRHNLVLNPRFDPAALLTPPPDVSVQAYDLALRARFEPAFRDWPWQAWT
jgi:hypothetical protein